MSAGKKKSLGMPFLAMLGDGSPKARAAFERNARIALKHPERLQPGLKEELERYLADPLKAAAEDGQHWLDQLAQFNQGRPRDVDDATAHIRQLATEHPTLKPTPLYKLRDQSIIKKMHMGTWRNKVAAARRK